MIWRVIRTGVVCVALLVAVVGCSSSSSSPHNGDGGAGSGGAAGSADAATCNGTSCDTATQFCLQTVSTDAKGNFIHTGGTCTALPAGCDTTLACNTQGCLPKLHDAVCPSSGGATQYCNVIDGMIFFACNN
jgi:hypothetical protein